MSLSFSIIISAPKKYQKDLDFYENQSFHFFLHHPDAYNLRKRLYNQLHLAYKNLLESDKQETRNKKQETRNKKQETRNPKVVFNYFELLIQNN